MKPEPVSPNHQLGNYVSRLMKSRYVTIPDFAARSGFSVGTINKWRAGDMVPTYHTINAFRGLLNLTDKEHMTLLSFAHMVILDRWKNAS
jgi:transcriptional regulator with XRE-family HTH domain